MITALRSFAEPITPDIRPIDITDLVVRTVQKLDPENAYLTVNERPAWALLERLLPVDRGQTLQHSQLRASNFPIGTKTLAMKMTAAMGKSP